MAAETIIVQFSADIKDIKDKLEQVASDVKSGTEKISAHITKMAHETKGAVENMKHSFHGLAEGMEALGNPLMKFAALLGAGAFLKDAIDTTIKYNLEVAQTSRVLGVSLEKATAWNMAMGEVGGSADGLKGAVMMMNRQIATGGENFARYGISLKDAKGEMRPMGEVMLDVLSTLKEAKSQQDQNIMSTQLLGRRAEEAAALLRMESDAFGEMTERARKLNMIVSGDSVAAAREYKKSLHEMGETVEALKMRIAQELMPAMISFNNWAAEEGPASLSVLSTAIKTIVIAWMAVKFAVEAVAIFITTEVMAMVAVVKGAADVMWKLMKGDWAGAIKAAKTGMADIKNEITAGIDEITSRYKAMGLEMNYVWDPSLRPKTAGKGDKTRGNVTASTGDTGAGLQIAQLQAQEEVKQAQWVKDQRIKIDRQLVEENQMSHAEMIADARKAAEEAYAIEFASIEKLKKLSGGKPIEAKRAEAAAAELHRKHIAEIQALDIEAAKFKVDLEKSSDAMIHSLEEAMVKESRDLAKAKAEGEIEASNYSFELQRANLERAVEIGRISELQQLAELKKIREQELQVILGALNEEQIANKNNFAKWQEIENKKNAAIRKNTLDQQKFTNDQLKAQTKTWKAFIDTLSNQFSTCISGLIKGTMSFRDAWQNIWGSVIDFAVQQLVKLVTEWIAKQLIMLVAEESTDAAKSASSMLAAKTEAASNIPAAAGTYAVNAMASVASIPMVGWAMAPGVGAAALAEGLAMLGVAAAAGGWDQVPSDQLSMVHKDEMVMSAPLAQGIREMVSQGGGGSQGTKGAQHTHHWHVQAMDGASFLKTIKNNQDGLFNVLHEGSRNWRGGGM